MSTTIKTVIGSLAANAVALAVAFGATLSATQQITILAFIGSLTTATTTIIAWHEKHKLNARVALATNGGLTSSEQAKTLTGK